MWALRRSVLISIENLRCYALTWPLKCYILDLTVEPLQISHVNTFMKIETLQNLSLYIVLPLLSFPYIQNILLLRISLNFFFYFVSNQSHSRVCIGFSIDFGATLIEFSACFILRTVWQHWIVLHFEQKVMKCRRESDLRLNLHLFVFCFCKVSIQFNRVHSLDVVSRCPPSRRSPL